MAEACYCVAVSPDNLALPGAACPLGAGPLGVPEGRYTEDCPFSCPLSEHRDPPGQGLCNLGVVLPLLKESVDTRVPTARLACSRARKGEADLDLLLALVLGQL